MKFRLLVSFVAIFTAFACGAPQTGELPRKPTFGAQLAPVPAELREKAGLKEGEGLLLPQILPGQTAEAAGLKNGDILVALDGKPVTGNGSVLQLVNSSPSGKTVEFEYIRDGKRAKTTGKLVERPREKSDQYDLIYTHVVSNGKRMRMVVSKPKTAGKFPAMLLIQGLGPAVMDTPLTGPGAYSKILHAFATDGWAPSEWTSRAWATARAVRMRRRTMTPKWTSTAKRWLR